MRLFLIGALGLDCQLGRHDCGVLTGEGRRVALEVLTMLSNAGLRKVNVRSNCVCQDIEPEPAGETNLFDHVMAYLCFAPSGLASSRRDLTPRWDAD